MNVLDFICTKCGAVFGTRLGLAAHLEQELSGGHAQQRRGKQTSGRA